MFLGYTLAVLSILGTAKVAVAMLVLGVPIIDAFWIIVRRLAQGRSPFSPDRGHLHHRLLDVGLSHRQTVLLIYGICVVLGLLAMLLSGVDPALRVHRRVLRDGLRAVHPRPGRVRDGHARVRGRPGRREALTSPADPGRRPDGAPRQHRSIRAGLRSGPERSGAEPGSGRASWSGASIGPPPVSDRPVFRGFIDSGPAHSAPRPAPGRRGSSRGALGGARPRARGGRDDASHGGMLRLLTRRPGSSDDADGIPLELLEARLRGVRPAKDAADVAARRPRPGGLAGHGRRRCRRRPG